MLYKIGHIFGVVIIIQKILVQMTLDLVTLVQK